jgi:hypothetical protein
MTEPYIQGDLSNLCGIYSVVNAYKVSYGTDDALSDFMYNEIVEYLSKKKILKDVLTRGMGFKHLNMVMRDVAGKYLPYGVSWMSFQTPTLNVFWNSMKSHLKTPGNCIILGVSNREEHWTVVEKSTPRGLRLCDSNGWKYLRKSMCTMDKTDMTKYRIYPAQNFYVFGKGE